MLPEDFWVISDTHFFHDNIVKFCQRDTQLERLIGPRPSRRDYDHNKYMLKRWNEIISVDDPVLHLGDVAFGRGGMGPNGYLLPRYEVEISPYLNGKKYLILGNHDRDDVDWDRLGYTVIGEFGMVVNNKCVTFSHYPLDPSDAFGLSDNEYHVHGHIHNNGYPVVGGEHGWRHGTTPSSRNQINVSVEMIDYAPQKLSSLIP